MTKVWRSGSAWVATLIAQSIAERGASIAFVAPRSEPESREPTHPNVSRWTTPRELVNGEPKLSRVMASFKRIGGSIGSVLALRCTTRNFIFSIPEPLIFTLPLYVALRLSRAKVIYIAHDAEPHAWNYSGYMRKIERISHALSYKLSTYVVALTPTVKDALVKGFQIDPKKIVVIPHGPFSIGDAGEVPGSRNLLLFGSLRRNKSVLEVIKAVILARRRGLNIKLILAGEPLKQEPGYWDECLARISEDPDGFILRVGFLPDAALPDLVRQSDAFVLAYTDFSSQSGVGVMASLASRPVIGTRSGGLGELYDRGMVGECIEGDVTPQNVAAALEAFYSIGAGDWAKSASEGASKIARTLTWSSIADQYIELCRR